VGNAGANQSWDFTNVIMQQNLEEWRFLDPINTPFANDFPTANMSVLVIEQAYADTFYLFFRVENTVFLQLGFAISYQGTSHVAYDSSSTMPLPLAMGSQWTEVDSFQFTLPSYIEETVELVEAEVDAWGSITIPNRTLNCLRLQEKYTEITNIYINNILFSSDTSRYINYEWLGQELLLIANASSQENDTNPNFTQASYFMRDVTNPNFLEDKTTQLSEFTLFPNYPNPFNPVTTIEFYLPKTDEVTLKIFNVLGEELTTLLSASLLSGFHTYQWNASNMPSGIYYYQIQAGDFREVKKMILMK
jgi:hypothetical protein